MSHSDSVNPARSARDSSTRSSASDTFVLTDFDRRSCFTARLRHSFSRPDFVFPRKDAARPHGFRAASAEGVDVTTGVPPTSVLEWVNNNNNPTAMIISQITFLPARYTNNLTGTKHRAGHILRRSRQEACLPVRQRCAGTTHTASVNTGAVRAHITAALPNGCSVERNSIG